MRMGRTVGIWQSPLRLGICSMLMATLLIVSNLIPPLDEVTDLEEDEENFMNDVDYAVESMQYMHDLQRGTAEIRPVVEPMKSVHIQWCWFAVQKPSNIVENGWINNNNEYFMYSAYYDRRENSLYPNNHAIQVIGMSRRSIQKRKYYCNLHTIDDSTYFVVEATIREIWQRAWDPRNNFFVPNLVTCPVPNELRDRELTVSVTNRRCADNSQALLIRNSKKGAVNIRNAVAVCVKGLDFLEDVSQRLLEWIELQFLLGADKIVVYSYFVSKRTAKVLDFYQQSGRLDHISLTLPDNSPNQPFIRSKFIWRNRQQKRRHELIPYNDCLYRHIASHRFILIVDTDEVVVPMLHANWSQMLDEMLHDRDKPITSISIRNVFKFPTKNEAVNSNASLSLFMLQNRRRSTTTSKAGDYGKSFTSTQTVATVFNHFALHRLHANVLPTIYAPIDIALKLHYKEQCPIESRDECPDLIQHTVDDPSLDRFADALIERVRTVNAIIDSEGL